MCRFIELIANCTWDFKNREEAKLELNALRTPNVPFKLTSTLLPFAQSTRVLCSGCVDRPMKGSPLSYIGVDKGKME